MKKSDRVAALSFFTSLIRVLGGPITIIMVSSMLSTEEMGFYFTFFSFVVMAQLFEVGVGFVLKQYYSHDCKYDENKNLTQMSAELCGHLLKFSIQWYACLTILYTVVLIPLGYLYYADYSGDIEWELPYIVLICCVAIRIFSNVLDSYLDGMQHQVLLNKARLFSSLSMSVTIWICIYSGLELFSLAISQAISVLVFISILYTFRTKFIDEIQLKLSDYSFKTQFKRIFPLLGKTSVVWFFGYFFWNGFTLLGFKLYGAEIGGLIGLSIALAKGGYDVANSFLMNQRTMIANNIANNKFEQAYSIFVKYFSFSLMVLVLGYSGFFVVKSIFPSFYLFDKILQVHDLVSIFGFYLMILYMTGVNNFVRAYKIEPFIYMSIYNALSVCLAFYITPILDVEGLFYLSLLALAPSLVYSTFIYSNKVTQSKKAIV
ncbi:hypothetical protein [Agaribacter flavus]|uniref:Polysaccharide biosynthesis protein n=1 Tax=Agaribacter flavus TaxID=1902781 RepID=A0ABV7FLT8_9ALTE